MKKTGKKKIPANLEGFKARFQKLMQNNTQAYWAEAIGISQSVISDRWKKGSMPRADKLLKFIEITGVSANWLLLGIGPREIADLNEEKIEKAQNANRRTQIQMMQDAEKKRVLEERIKKLESLLAQGKLIKKIEAHVLPPGDNECGDRVFERHVLPAIALIQSINQVVFKIIENYASKELDEVKLKQIIDWIHDNFNQNRNRALTKVKGLDKIIAS